MAFGLFVFIVMVGLVACDQGWPRWFWRRIGGRR